MLEYACRDVGVAYQPFEREPMTSTNAPLRPTLVPFRERSMGLIDFEQMWSTDKELPYVAREEEPLGTWVGMGEFSGDVIPRKANCDPLVGEVVSGTWRGPTALTIVGDDLLGIVAPEDSSEPAVWFWVTRDGVTGFGAEAASTSRADVTLSGEAWTLRLRDVAQLDQPCWVRTLDDSISLQAPAETPLLGALRSIGLAEEGSRVQPPAGTPASKTEPLGGQEPGAEVAPTAAPPPEQWVEKLGREPAPIVGAILQGPLESIRFGSRLRRLGLLGIGCAVTSRDPPISGGIPYSEFGEDADGSWGALAMFVGEAALLDDDGVLHPAQNVVLGGSCALTLVGDRLLGILDADDEGRQLWASDDIGVPEEADQSVWFSAARSSLTLETSGEQGVFGKRPALLQVSADGWDLHLRHVYRFTRACTPETAERRNSAQPRAENSLVAALARS